MACRGICSQYKAVKSLQGNIRYEIGQKRCTLCDIFTEWNGVRCPCCNGILRTRPKNTRHRTKIMQEIKRI
jgi:hypothetical protein